jgi:hypothetical protein
MTSFDNLKFFTTVHDFEKFIPSADFDLKQNINRIQLQIPTVGRGDRFLVETV